MARAYPVEWRCFVASLMEKTDTGYTSYKYKNSNVLPGGISFVYMCPFYGVFA